MNDSFKNVMFDKILRLTYPYFLLYRDLLVFTLHLVIFHSQIPLLNIWYLAVVYFQFKCTCFLVIAFIYIENLQSIDLLCKSIDWFLYERNTHI